MDQIGVEGEDSLVMAEALMLALRKWGRIKADPYRRG